jgi:fermentation-respiration switch protein FrsA (DUF1100 family)
VTREDVALYSDGVRCAAWLFRPEGDGPHPCVVMAHGFSAVRDQRLDAFAKRFADAGLAALVFDYRHFGASDGEPRRLLSIRRQLDDWRAAIVHARATEGIDPDRIALWGSSFSGGHVVATAARDPRVAAVVSQVPYTFGITALAAAGPRGIWNLTVHGLRDAAAALLGREPHRIPAVGPPGSVAAMTEPTALPGFLAMTPPGSTWVNEYTARLGLTVLGYNPYRRLGAIRCPVLVAIAEDDATTPARPAARAARRAPNATLARYPGGHFDLYLGEPFERAVADQVEFLTRALLVSAESSSPSPDRGPPARARSLP